MAIVTHEPGRYGNVQEWEVAWFAGFMDGEGSIGIVTASRSGKWGNAVSLRPLIQFSTTSLEALEKSLDIVGRLDITKSGYTFQEKKPEKHKDAFYLRIARINDIRKLCEAIIPYAVLKRQQWEIMLQFVNSRLEGVEVKPDGRLPQGGDWKREKRLYSEFEIECARQLYMLNNRGVDLQQRIEQWNSKVNTYINQYPISN